MQTTFLWHDYETFGVDPRRDFPAQFAALRSDAAFQPIGEPLVLYCRPPADLLPSPEACLITGITPQLAARDGVPEPEFFARIHEQMAEPGTCTLGYNSIRFDDEVTRHGLWRNFFDPYGREWRNGCSRWDLIDVARMFYALRPQGVAWPTRADGAASFKLSDLSAANHIAHSHAHDALADVEATLALARLLRSAQPRLFDYLFALREKRKAAALLDWAGQTPVLHASTRFSAERGGLAMVLPLAPHPTQPNGVIVLDLDADPQPLLELSIADIRDRVFVANKDLPEGVARIPLKTVHTNKCPALAPLATLAGVDTARIRLNVERCQRHLEQVRSRAELPGKVRQVFAEVAAYPAQAAEQDLYAGLPGNADLALAAKVRGARPDQLLAFEAQFVDPRYRELLFRYRARHHADTLTGEEQSRWRQWRRRRLIDDPDLPERGLIAVLERLAALRSACASDGHALTTLDQVEAWCRAAMADLQ